MSGSAGLSPLRNRKPEGSTLRFAGSSRPIGPFGPVDVRRAQEQTPSVAKKPLEVQTWFRVKIPASCHKPLCSCSPVPSWTLSAGCSGLSVLLRLPMSHFLRRELPRRAGLSVQDLIDSLKARISVTELVDDIDTRLRIGLIDTRR
jgi:hypothetical protein